MKNMETLGDNQFENRLERVSGSEFIASFRNGKAILEGMGEIPTRSPFNFEAGQIVYNLDRIFGGRANIFPANNEEKEEMRKYIDTAVNAANREYQMTPIHLPDEKRKRARDFVYQKLRDDFGIGLGE
jgi:hypothetical protein